MDAYGDALGKNSWAYRTANAITANTPGGNEDIAHNLTIGLLDKLGIKANIDLGLCGTGIGEKNNTYTDKATGKALSHAEVLQRVRMA